MLPKRGGSRLILQVWRLKACKLEDFYEKNKKTLAKP